MTEHIDTSPTFTESSDHDRSSFLHSRWELLRCFVIEQWWAVVSLLLVVCVLYAPTLKYEFLNLDDLAYVVDNDLIKSWHPLNLYRVATEPVARNFAPLTIVTFLVEHTVWGLQAGGYHATNYLLHAINSILVYTLIRQLTGSRSSGWVVAMLFAVHPIQVESVAWISSRKTLLSSTFMLACGLCYLRPNRTGRDEGWGLMWLILGLLSKASTVVVPPIVVAYDVLIQRHRFEKAATKQIFPCVLCAMLTFITMSSQVTQIGGTRDHLAMNKLQLIGVDATLMCRYLVKLAVPVDLCLYYDPPWRDIWPQIAAAVTIWGSMAGLLWWKRDHFPGLAFAMAAWLWLLFPVMNFFPITTLMNDRYLYLPCLAVFAVVVETVRWSCESLGKRQAVVMFLGVSLVAITASARLTALYLPVWRNPMTLWSYAREQTPSLVIVQRQWADALRLSGDVEGALLVLQEILDRHHPDEGEVTLIHQLQREWSSKKQ